MEFGFTLGRPPTRPVTQTCAPGAPISRPVTVSCAPRVLISNFFDFCIFIAIFPPFLTVQTRGSHLAAILHLETSGQPLKLPCSSEEPPWSPEKHPGAEDKRPRVAQARGMVPQALGPSLGTAIIPSPQSQPRRQASLRVRAVLGLEIENNEEVGEDTYRPKDSSWNKIPIVGECSCPHRHEHEDSEEESEGVESPADSGGESEGVEPEEDILAPLPEQRVALHARAKNGDKAAMEEIETWANLDEEGKIVTYGGDHESSQEGYLDDEVYDLIEEEESSIERSNFHGIGPHAGRCVSAT